MRATHGAQADADALRARVRPQFDRINEVVREQVKQRARIKAERKAAFEHKWFGCVLRPCRAVRAL